MYKGLVLVRGEHLSNEGDGLVAHGVSVTNISLDNVVEWFLDTGLQFLRIEITWDCSISELVNAHHPPQITSKMGLYLE